MRPFDELLAEAIAFHGHLCPGQVLGVRMTMAVCRALGVEEPKSMRKCLVVFVEIDRCATDAIQALTGCSLGKRTLKHLDYGKMAATFVDTQTGNAVRVIARDDAREKALAYCEGDCETSEAQLIAYQKMPDDELLVVQRVKVDIPPEDLPGRPLRRATSANARTSAARSSHHRPCATTSTSAPLFTVPTSVVPRRASACSSSGTPGSR